VRTIDKPPSNEDAKSFCGVSMKFNFTMGAIAIGLAVIIGYAVWRYFG
jgi:hypothetical protein